MSRRRRDSRPATPGHGTARERADFREDQRYVETLRRCQLAAAAVMLVGLTTSTMVCAGEFKATWLVVVGGVILFVGIGIFAMSGPITKRLLRNK